MPRHLRLAGIPAIWLFVPPLAFAALNNIALKHEAAARPFWKLATEEVSSVVVILALVPLLIFLARRWPPAFKPAVLARHIGGSLAFSALHVAGMLAIRHAVFAAAGAEYRPGPLPAMFLYEYGKDVIAYALIVVAVGWVDRRFAARQDGAPPSAVAPGFEVKTTRGTVLVPAGEVLRIEAAGNYATLVTGAGAFLHRATMREIEAALPPDRFARTHRSHIVRLDAIDAIRGQDGEREIRLVNGDAVPLSRRYAQGRDWLLPLHRGSAKAMT